MKQSKRVFADGAMFPFESIGGFRLRELVNYHLEIPGGLYTDSLRGHDEPLRNSTNSLMSIRKC